MRRFLLIPLLAFGTVAGFAHGFHSLHRCHDRWREAELDRRELFAPPPAPVVVAPAPAVRHDQGTTSPCWVTSRPSTSSCVEGLSPTSALTT